MGSDVSATSYRGVIIPDPRIDGAGSIWAAQSSYSEASPRVDSPERVSGETALTLKAAGTIQTAQESESLRIRIQESGLPGAAGFVWKNDGDTVSRGWNPPSVATGWDAIEWTDGSGTVKATSDPHSVTLPDQTVILTYELEKASTREVVTRKFDPAAETWGAAVTVYTASATTAILRPCLCVLPSGRVLLYHWEEQGTTAANIRMHYTNDDGATWTQGSGAVLASSVVTAGSPGSGVAGYAIGRLRAVYHSGTVCLVAALIQHDIDPHDRDVFGQWVSTDLGGLFALVSYWDGVLTGDTGGGYHDLVSFTGSIGLVYIQRSNSNRPTIRRVASGFDSLASADWTSIASVAFATSTGGVTGNAFTAGDLTSWADPSGDLYVIGRNISANNEGLIFRSANSGRTWEALGQSDVTVSGDPVGKVWDLGLSTTYPKGFNATAQAGRALFFHNWASATGNEDDSIGCLLLGGFTSVTTPPLAVINDQASAVTYGETWIPIDLPSDVAWTAAGSGSAALTGGDLVLASSGSGTAKHYRRNPAGAYANGCIVQMALSPTAGGTLGTTRIAAIVRVADGTNQITTSLRFQNTGSAYKIRFYDNEGGAQIGTDVTIAVATGGIDVLIAMGGANARFWYKRRSTTARDQEWLLGASTAALTDAGAALSTNLVQFGRITSDATAAANWHYAAYTFGSYVGLSGSRLAGGQTNPQDLRPRQLTTALTPVTGGITLAAVDGPGYRGDIHKIDIIHDYQITKATPGGQPSPRVSWRSQDETEQRIALAISPAALLYDSASGNSDPLSDVIGVGLFGINFKTALIQGYETGAGAWSTLATLDASTSFDSLPWIRKGGTVRPNGDASPIPFIYAHEMEGGSFKFDGGKCRKISHNSPGSWSTSATRKRCALALEGIDGTEGATGTGGEVWARDAVQVIQLNGAEFSAYRIKITASQGTAAGYYEIGSIVCGPVFIFPTPYGYGRSIRTEPNTEITTGQDGIDQAAVYGPGRRIVSFAWKDGIDETTQGGTSPDPDIVFSSTGAGALAVGAKGSTPRNLDGLIRQLEGGAKPLVYLPRLPRTATQVATLNRRAGSVLGRLFGPIVRDTVTGEENEAELVRINQVTIREIV